MCYVFERTLKRRQYFTEAGYNYEELWECELKEALKDDDEMAAFIAGIDITEPLIPRAAFFGGRTTPITLRKMVTGEDRIRYADYVSLYPTVIKKRSYPLGHPVIITENFETLEPDNFPYFGLIKCDVLPPRGLFYPVLPMRCAGKLQFTLCQTCSETLAISDCNHNDAERCLKGTWCTPELQKALAMGYFIVKIYEVWHYDRKSDPTDTSSKLSHKVMFHQGRQNTTRGSAALSIFSQHPTTNFDKCSVQ